MIKLSTLSWKAVLGNKRSMLEEDPAARISRRVRGLPKGWAVAT
jgi:hypothetical protein